MKDKPPPRLHRATTVYEGVGAGTRRDAELIQNSMKADVVPDIANADAQGTVLVMNAHGNDCAVKIWIEHPRHREEKSACQELRFTHVQHCKPESSNSGTGQCDGGHQPHNFRWLVFHRPAGVNVLISSDLNGRTLRTARFRRSMPEACGEAA